MTDETRGLDPHAGEWINPPRTATLHGSSLEIVTEPRTDFWQRTYYGFRTANAPALLWSVRDNVTFGARASFRYARRFDQCGVIVYLDQNNWCKASIEHAHGATVPLGSVVTNGGHSDWATSEIEPCESMSYRVSRRGPDFLIESAVDGEPFRQMRVFHLATLGDTRDDTVRAHPPPAPDTAVRFGVYACSPERSSFTATFDALCVEPCRWRPHDEEPDG